MAKEEKKKGIKVEVVFDKDLELYFDHQARKAEKYYKKIEKIKKEILSSLKEKVIREDGTVTRRYEIIINGRSRPLDRDEVLEAINKDKSAG